MGLFGQPWNASTGGLSRQNCVGSEYTTTRGSGGAPLFGKSLSWCEPNSNFTRVDGCYIPDAPCMAMYGIFTNIYPINDPNVGKYTIHYMEHMGISTYMVYKPTFTSLGGHQLMGPRFFRNR